MWKNNIYRVQFETKLGGVEKHAIDIEANNMDEAKKAATDLWYKDNKAHAFSVTARRLTKCEQLDYNYFKRINNKEVERD